MLSISGAKSKRTTTVSASFLTPGVLFDKVFTSRSYKTEDAKKEAFLEALLADHENEVDGRNMLRSIVFAEWDRQAARKTAPAVRAPRRTREQIKAATAAVVAAGVAKHKAIVEREARAMVLDMVIDGKRIGDHTFGQLGKLGAGFARLAKGGNPRQIVGKVLTGEQAQKLYDGK